MSLNIRGVRYTENYVVTTCQSARLNGQHYRLRLSVRKDSAHLGNDKTSVYLRVSTALQGADNHKRGIVEYTYAEGLQPAGCIEETRSGKTPIKERKLQQVIDSMVQGDTLIVSELSRLSRNMVEVMTVLDQLIKKGCRVHAVKGG
jgi:hypothetical protein